MRKLIEYFVRNKLIVNIFIVIVFGFGLISLSGLERETLPEVDFDILTIKTIYPGAAPRDVELNVSKKVEDELNEVDGLEKFISISNDNISTVVVWVDINEEDPDEIKDEIKKAVDRAEAEFPDDVEKPVVTEIKTDNIPIIRFQVSSDAVSEKELRLIARNLEDELEDLEGVSKVSKIAYRDLEIKVLGDLMKMKTNDISLKNISDAIKTHNIRSGGGTLESLLSEKSIVTLTEFTNLKEIEDVVIRSNFENMSVKVKDVAKVKEGFADRDIYARGNKINGIVLYVFKKDQYDIIKTVDSVRKHVEKFKNKLRKKYHKIPQVMLSQIQLCEKFCYTKSIADRSRLKSEIEFGDKVKVFGFNDITKSTRRLLSITRNNSLIGLLMVVLTLLIFLEIRVALWTAFGIPIAMMMVFIFMSIVGFSINNISLFGLITVLGILVDDGIVAAENIHRHKELGFKGKLAAITGAHQVFYPILGTVLTTILAFLPLAFMSGIMGKFVFQLPIVVIIALLASLIEVFVALPSHLSKDLKIKGKHKKAETRRWFQYILKAYRFVLKKALKVRYLVVILFILMMVAAIFIGKTMKFQLFSNKETERINLILEAPSGTSLDEMQRRTQKVEDLITKKIPQGVELDSIFTIIGSSQVRTTGPGGPGNHLANIQVYLTPFANRKRSAAKIVSQLRKEIRILNMAMSKKNKLTYFKKTTILERRPGPPVGDPIELKVISNDEVLRKRFTGEILNFLKNNGKEKNQLLDRWKKDPVNLVNTAIIVTQAVQRFNDLGDGIFGLQVDSEDQKDEIRVEFINKEMYKLGVNPLLVAQTVRTAYKGEEVSSIVKSDEDIEIVVQVDKKYKRNIKFLKELLIPTKYGKQIKLSKIARFPIKKSQASVRRYNGRRADTITGQIDFRVNTPTKVMGMVMKKFAPMVAKHPAIRLKMGGEAQSSADSISDATTALIYALFGIFVILLLIFRSITQPLFVLSVIPFGFIGIILSFKLHMEPLGFFALIGLVGLTGVVVNDSIVMVDFMNRLKKELDAGDNIISKVVEGAGQRLRPIILTTITTVMGLFPTVYGWGGSNAFLRPLTMAMAYGLMFGTLITLFLIPSLYMIDHDIKRVYKKIKSADFSLLKDVKYVNKYAFILGLIFSVIFLLISLKSKNKAMIMLAFLSIGTTIGVLKRIKYSPIVLFSIFSILPLSMIGKLVISIFSQPFTKGLIISSLLTLVLIAFLLVFVYVFFRAIQGNFAYFKNKKEGIYN